MLWSELGSLECPDTSELEGKTKQKPPEVEEAREGKRVTGGNTGHHGRGAHHGQTVVATGGSARLFSPCAAFWSFGISPWAAGFCLSWGILGLFLLASFDPHGPHFISLDSSQSFLPKSWLES